MFVILKQYEDKDARIGRQSTADDYKSHGHVAYLTMAGIDALETRAFGPSAICHKATVRPCRNNLALLVRP